MAILIQGMKCGLCGKPMMKGEETISFSAFVSNEADPLFRFSDGVFHAECFRKHPSAHSVEARYTKVREGNKPENRRCLVCGEGITDPDDSLSLGYLTDDVLHPLHRLNCTHLHRSCLNRWSELANVAAFAQKQLESGAWSGKGMRWLFEVLKHAQMK